MATNDGGAGEGAAAAAGAAAEMQLLGAMQLSDSMFPSGLFAASNGLESMFLDGSVTSADGLAGLCRTLIGQQVGPCDCVMAARACSLAAAGDDAGLADLDAECAALKPVREQREAAARSGAQLARCVERFGGGGGVVARYCRAVSSGAASGTYPVALGACCGSLGMSPGHAALVALYGFAASMVGAALRLGIIHHVEGQEIIHGLKPQMAAAAREAEGRAAGGGDAEGAWQFAPLAEIAQMGHERMDARMFVS